MEYWIEQAGEMMLEGIAGLGVIAIFYGMLVYVSAM